MTYIQDLTGTPIPVGKIGRTLVDWSPAWQPMPPTLTIDSGSGTVFNPATSRGYLKLSGSTSRVRLRTANDLDLSQFAEVSWTVYGAHSNVNTNIAPTLSIEDDAGTVGAGFYQLDNDSTARCRLGRPAGSPVVVYSQYNQRNSERPNSRNLTLQIRPQTGEVRVFEDDQVVFDLPFTNRASLNVGAARACFLSPMTALSQAIYCSRVVLAVTHS